MMAFHCITFYLQYVHVHYLLSFMKVRDQGLYLHSQPTRPCFVTWTAPAQLNKNIIKSVGLYAWKMRASLEGVWYSVQNGTYAT